MKAIGVIGFKKSGKTTLTKAIARLLKNRGHNVAVIKHSSKPFDHGFTDTGQFMKEIRQIGFITPENSEIILKGEYNIAEIISYINADFLIIEGFKSVKYFPKIICLKQEDERKILDDGLAIFSVSMDASLKKQKIVDYLISEENNLEKIAEQVEKRAFILPDINCGKCGYNNCYSLAQAIVQGKETQKKCIYFQDLISISINKKRIYLNQFMSKLYLNIIHGMFSPLKDVGSLQNAKIVIDLGSLEGSEQRKDKSRD